MSYERDKLHVHVQEIINNLMSLTVAPVVFPFIPDSIHPIETEPLGFKATP